MDQTINNWTVVRKKSLKKVAWYALEGMLNTICRPNAIPRGEMGLTNGVCVILERIWGRQSHLTDEYYARLLAVSHKLSWFIILFLSSKVRSTGEKNGTFEWICGELLDKKGLLPVVKKYNMQRC